MRILFFLLSFLCNANAPFAQTDFKSFRDNAWVELNVDEALWAHLDALTPDERIEQIRDWFMLSVIQWMGQEDVVEIAFDIPPLRYDFQQELEPFRFGEGRHLPLKNGELIIFSPVESPRRTVNIARAADEFRLLRGQRPKVIHLFEYQCADEASPNRFRYTGQVDVGTVFSTAYGYVEKIVVNNEKKALSDFLSAIDDVVYVRKDRSGYTFGGRQYAGFKMKGVTLEDLAVLAQADQNGGGEENSHFQEIYEGYIDEWAKWLQISIKNNGIYDWKFCKISLHINVKSTIECTVPSNRGPIPPVSFQAIKEHCKHLMPLSKFKSEYQHNDGFNLGFSLDPTLQKKALSESLYKLNSGNKRFHRRWFEEYVKQEVEKDCAKLDSSKASIQICVQAFLAQQSKILEEHPGIFSLLENSLQKGDGLLLNKITTFLGGEPNVPVSTPQDGIDIFIKEQIHLVMSKVNQNVNLDTHRPDRETWEAWLRECPEQKERLTQLYRFIKHLEVSHSYQKARYDGNFRGTAVGMTMFYTDLIMKLWSIDYQSSAPEKIIPGFLAQTNLLVSPLYMDNMEEKKRTRSWLGLWENGYEIYGGNEMFFTHRATRIFNKAPDDLTEKETEANVGASRFSEWWNNHFSQVADYEPEYHRLNQIMKWAQIVFYMKTEMDFDLLYQEKVNRSFDFEAWYASQNNLTTKVNLHFLDKTALGESVECLEILKSKTFFMFKDINITSRFSGGVGLGTKGEVVAKKQAKHSQQLRSRPEVVPIENTPSQNRYKTTSKGKIRVDSQTGRIDIKQESNEPLKGTGVEYAINNVQRNIKKNADDLHIAMGDIGQMKFKGDGNATSVSFQEGRIAKANHVMRNVDHLGRLDEGLSESNQFAALIHLSGKSEKWIGQLKETGDWMQFDANIKPKEGGYDFYAATSTTWYSGKKYAGGKFITAEKAWQALKGDEHSLIAYQPDKKLNTNNILPLEMVSQLQQMGLKEGVSVRFQANNTSISVGRNGIVRLPRNPSKENLFVVEKVSEKLSANAVWKSVLSKQTQINKLDAEFLASIDARNPVLGKRYFEMNHRSVGLRENEVVVCFDHHAEAPQMIVKDRWGCRLEVPTAKEKVSMDEIAQKVKNFYAEKNPDVNEFIKVTKPIYEYLGPIGDKIGSQGKIIVMEKEHINSGLIAALHKMKTPVFPDTLDVALSLSHIRDSIFPDIESMVFLCTAPWDNNPTLSALRDSISSLGIQTMLVTDTTDFKSALSNLNWRQIFLLANSNGAKMLFGGQMLDFRRVEHWLNEIAKSKGKKDFVYFLTEEALEAKKVMSNSGLFSYTIVSHLENETNGAAPEGIGILQDFAKECIGETLNIGSKEWGRLINEHPDIEILTQKVTDQTGTSIQVRLGRLSAAIKKQFDGNLLLALRKNSRNPTNDFPTLDKLFPQQQQKMLSKLTSFVASKAAAYLKAIPLLKVDIDKINVKITTTC